MREHFPRYLRGVVTYEEQRRAAAWSLFPDVLPCLATLAPHTLGIISNGNGVEQREKLATTGIAGHFQFVHISADCGHPKPAAEIFHLGCRTASCSVRDAIYVGDLYEIDAVGARSAGLTGVWLDRRSNRGPEHAPPIIGGLSELSALATILEERS